MKILTIYLSIMSLLYLQLSPAYAQKDYTGGKEKAEGKEKLAKDLEDLKKETKSASTTLGGETDDNKVTEASEDTASIVMTTLFLLVIMIAAPMWLIWCPKPDTGIHAVAGVIAIVLEGVFWGLYEKGSTKALEIYEADAKTGYSAQIDSMKTAMEITLKAKTWMDAKFGVQVAIAVLIGVAMAVVLIMSIIQTVRSLGVEAPIAQNCATSYNDSPFKKFDASKLYSMQTKPFNMSLGRDETIKRFSNCDNIGELAFVNEEISRISSGEIQSSKISDYEIIKKDKELNTLVETNKFLFKEFKEALKNLTLLSAAHAATTTDEAESSTPTEKGDKTLNSADIGPKLAAIGVAVPAIIGAIVMKVQTTLTWTAWNGWIRAGFYAAEIILVGVVASFSKKTADELGRRADAYKKLYEQLTTIMANQPTSGGAQITPLPPNIIAANAKSEAIGEMNGKCFTDGPGGGASADPSCSCKASKSCKKTNLPKMKFPNFKTPGILATSSRLAEDMGNKMFSGDMAGASISGQSLGRNAVAVKKMNEQLMALANKKLADFGKPPIDFQRNQSDMLGKIKNAAQSTWAGLSPAERDEATKAVMGGGTTKEKETTEVASAAPTEKTGTSSVGGKKKSIFDLIDDDKDKVAKGAEKKEEGEGKGLEAYEDSTKQIQDDGKASIFKIIEIRYMKSAYPVFFEKKEE